MDKDHEARAELELLANAHIRSALRLSAFESRARSGDPVSVEFIKAAADEASSREALIAWTAPDADLLTEKLLHLLVNVIEMDRGLDDISLGKITAEVTRFIGRTSEPPCGS